MNKVVKSGLILAALAAALWLWGYLGTESGRGADGANIGGGVARLAGPYLVGAGLVLALIGYLLGRRTTR